MKRKKYFGKYRGTVLNCVDPEGRARLIAQVPAVSSLLPTTWCEPCLPVTGMLMGAYAVPPIGAGVWIEFEEGDVQRPIWTGGFWGSGAEAPALAKLGNPVSPSIILQTSLQNTLLISDAPGPTGGLLLQFGAPAYSLSINALGIQLQAGAAQLKMLADGTVFITNGLASITLSEASVALNGLALVVT
jgi:hypothetical protein